MEGINLEYIQKAIEINITIIKTIFIIICTYFTNLKILNKKLNKDIKIFYKFCSIIIVAIVCCVIRYKINYLISIICLVLVVGLLFLEYKMLTTIISLCINYIISLISVIISFLPNILIKSNNNYLNLSIIIVIHILLLTKVLKMRRFSNGIVFLKENIKNEYIDIFILNISVIILFAIIILVNSEIALARDLTVGVIISSILMFVSIQKSLQLYYKQKLLIKELEETKEELAKKTKEIEDLEADNLNISKKSHTLAHKQKSLEYKLQEIINKTEISKEESAEVRDRLKEIEKDLYKEKTTVELDKTGIAQIDDMLKYMQAECKKNKIDFELQIKGNIHYMTNNLISISDLETLLADHIKNAIIAINHTDNVNRSILVRLGEIDGNYSLYIYDSGVEFEKETLENLDKKPSTTHANEGGTGMGFMNTFDTLRKCKASMIIEEYNEPSKENYTKVLMIKFDNKNEFKIKSYRTTTL